MLFKILSNGNSSVEGGRKEWLALLHYKYTSKLEVCVQNQNIRETFLKPRELSEFPAIRVGIERIWIAAIVEV
jgi:hypothetical protein